MVGTEISYHGVGTRADFKKQVCGSRSFHFANNLLVSMLKFAFDSIHIFYYHLLSIGRGICRGDKIDL